MPSVPKLVQAERLIRQVEVLAQIKAHDGGNADAHVAVAGEVAIDLGTVTDHRHETLEAGVEERVVEHPIVVLGDVVGKDRLLDNARDDQPQSSVYHLPADAFVAPYLREELVCTHDGTCQNKGKERDIEQIFEKRSRGGDPSTVDVGHVTDRLKRIEGDAHRQEDVGQTEVTSKQAIPCIKEETCVLETQQHTHAQTDGISEAELSEYRTVHLVHYQSQCPVYECRYGEDKEDYPVGFVEKVETEGGDVEHHLRLSVANEGVEQNEQDEHRPERTGAKQNWFARFVEERTGGVGEYVAYRICHITLSLWG